MVSRRPWAQDQHLNDTYERLIAWGEMIEASAHLQKLPYIWDMAPTLLCLAAVPIPTDMTGRVIAELVKPEYRELQRFGYREAEEADQKREDGLWTGEKDERLVEERLRGLRYLE